MDFESVCERLARIKPWNEGQAVRRGRDVPQQGVCTPHSSACFVQVSLERTVPAAFTHSRAAAVETSATKPLSGPLQAARVIKEATPAGDWCVHPRGGLDLCPQE